LRRFVPFLVVLLIGAACSDDQADPTTTTAASTTTMAATTTAASETTTTTQPESEESLPSDLEEDSAFGAGTYTMGDLGTSVTFTVGEEWGTRPVGQGFFVIARPDNTGPGEHDMVFTRPNKLYDATVGGLRLEGADLDGWLATVPDTASVSGPTTTTVAGIDAVTFEVAIGDDVSCFDGDSFCIPILLAGTEFTYSLNRGFLYEVFWIDHPEGPIVVINGTPEDDADWLDVARGVIATLEIG
jgi:hypothetical protein